MNQSDLEQIETRLMRAEKKYFTPPMILTLAITVAGWVYTAGVLSEQVRDNKATLETRRPAVEKVGVIMNDIDHIKRQVEEIKQQAREDKGEILRAISDLKRDIHQ